LKKSHLYQYKTTRRKKAYFRISPVPLHILLCKFTGDGVIETHADIGREVCAATDNVVPIALGQCGEVIATDTITKESEEDTSIEIVACTNGTYGGEGCYTIVLAERACT
jgi:hypothetical protein